MTIHLTTATIAITCWFIAGFGSLLCLIPFLRTCAERGRLDALAQQAADHGEPSRAQIEWEEHVAAAVAMSETPIYAALDRELFIADAMDEIEELTGGGAA